MAPKEPKSMAEVHEWRRRAMAKAKGKTLGQKLAWIDAHVRMLGVPPEEAKRFKKAS